MKCKFLRQMNKLSYLILKEEKKCNLQQIINLDWIFELLSVFIYTIDAE